MINHSLYLNTEYEIGKNYYSLFIFDLSSLHENNQSYECTGFDIPVGISMVIFPPNFLNFNLFFFALLLLCVT